MLAALVALAVGGPLAADGATAAMAFAAEMAEAGNWREARFRWERVAEDRPDDPRVLNNLAVAFEVLGSPEESQALYRRALELAPGDDIVRDNAGRATRFWSANTGDSDDPIALRAAAVASAGKIKPGRRGVRVEVHLPVPAKLDLGDRRTLLVASFLAGDDEILDANREMVRFLRGEFRRRTSLEILDVTPPPAIPEQTLDELAGNAEFWKFLGRRHDADVVVSGKIEYDRKDVSGFRDVDVVSPQTGQKVRTARFTEAEEFAYVVHLLFLDGRTGELLHRDSVARAVVYTGLNNDPYSAFFEISEGLAEDVLAVIAPQRRTDFRIVFRK